MLKKHMMACLVATAFAMPAMAQTSTSPSGSTDRPAATGSGSTTSGSSTMMPNSNSNMTTGSSSSSSTMSSNSGQFMTQIKPEQIMASDLIGTKVVSSNNESIGDINDVIVDRNGQAVAAVVGVGGFLGIGEKDVAIPFKSLEFASREQVNAMNGNNVNSTGSTNTTGTAGTMGATTGSPSTTGSTAMAPSATAPATTNASDANQPERVVLRMTKEELQSAPAFKTDPSDND